MNMEKTQVLSNYEVLTSNTTVRIQNDMIRKHDSYIDNLNTQIDKYINDNRLSEYSMCLVMCK